MAKLGKGTREMLGMTEDQFIDKIEEYFKKCDESGKPYLTVGLADHLKVHKNTLNDIRMDKTEAFKGTFHKEVLFLAIQRIELHLAEKLFENDNKNIAGTIFTLKSAHKWTDKNQVDINTTGTIKINFT